MSTDNSDLEDKVAVRRWVSEHVGVPLRVLDLYCGSEGMMYQHVWREAEEYLGVDKKTPHRLAQTVEMSAETAASTFDVDRYNLFDLDPHSSPWVVARRIIRRRGPGTFGMTVTSGEQHGMMSGKGNEIIRATLGLRHLSDTRMFGRFGEEVFRLMLQSLGEMPGVTMGSKAIIAGKRSGAYMVYYAGITVDKRHDSCYTASGCKRPHSTRRGHADSAIRRAGTDQAGVHREGHL